MLAYLRIRGLALLDDVTLDFARGMNVLTGETGAGKSIIIDALALLRGARGRGELIRQGEEQAIVDAQFELDGSAVSGIGDALEAHGLPRDQADALVISRSVARTGRGRSFLQAEITTQAALAKVGELLIDICSQHEHHSLTSVAKHIEMLDIYARLEPQLEAYGRSYRAWREAQQALESLRERAGGGGRRADYLRFQIEEIDRLAPEPGESERLRKRIVVLREAQRWSDFAREAYETLYEADDAVTGRLSTLLERARKGAADSERLAELEEQLAAAQVACEEAAGIASRFCGELEVEPGELERVEERMHELETLRRKHGIELEGLDAFVEAMRNELEELDNAEERIEQLRSEAEALLQACRTQADVLHERRAQAAGNLARALEDELAALHIPKARLEATVEPLSAGELGPRGGDKVEFLFSANPGEPLAPLSKVASGGELSRVLLALKGVLSVGDRVATYVFDEVDSGVGGAVAEAIGRRLRRAAEAHQVLCITHLPQIAAFADSHYRVEKLSTGGRTTTRVQLLTPDERIEELARMLGGAKVGDSARQHAKQLLEEARGGGGTKLASIKAAGAKSVATTSTASANTSAAAHKRHPEAPARIPSKGTLKDAGKKVSEGERTPMAGKRAKTKA